MALLHLCHHQIHLGERIGECHRYGDALRSGLRRHSLTAHELDLRGHVTDVMNLRHTAIFRLALGRSIPNLQASWVKMGIDGATAALGWGVNDLGGTLMEESITRMAGGEHGVRLDPPELIAAAHAAGRPAAERTTLYALREQAVPVGAVPSSDG